ncbi:MAG: Cys-tRNA(Pro) deacylase [Pseudohongiella sp.]|uniref:Cys-tRNA(Pro) deacylase n=1 Tax=Pseudohongiella sp. TaxID=1979412 RepID=UPI0034A0181D
MTPGINIAKKAGVSHRIHEYSHDAGAQSYGLEAAEKMGVMPQQVFKTLVVALETKALAVAVLPVSAMLNMKQIARAAGAKRASMAAAPDVQRSTGYVLGGVSPLGQKKALPTFIDESARRFDTIFVSAGRRGLEIELSPDDLAALTGASYAALSDAD